ncbi:hypothetical protein DRO34_06085 [Candidatus Bathyarchaeota archaeon]|nr:MAG: hypothetical protein DRO34_06085 [Candidatus Bathyarchaeota archaeon]
MSSRSKIGTLFIFLGLLLIIHHYVFWNRLFDVCDVLHHEFFEAVFFTAGITLLVSRCTDKKE